MATGELTIDLGAVCANWRALDAMSGRGVETAAVVKADGYGLGAGAVAEALAAQGVVTFFVAVAEEGAAVRAAVGSEPRIFVFSGHQPGDADALRQHDLIPLLNSPEQVARQIDYCPGHRFGIQLDTGMNRLGVEAADWAQVRGDLPGRAALLMSHLACADEPDHPMNARQLRVFREMTDGLDLPRSLAATGGILLGSEYHFDMTRPGIGLYGGEPFADAAPVVRLSVPVIQTRQVEAGESVGYGNAWVASEPRLIATISAGYADGLIRAMGPQAKAFADGTPCDVVGRVSMDVITVDVTGLRDVPDRLELLCAEQRVDDLARAAGTIGYEILTSLGSRYRRTMIPPQ